MSDDALSSLDDEELFGRAHLADRIFGVLRRVSEQSKSSIIGLVGSWGSGKSSVLGGLARRLSTKDGATLKSLGRDWLVAEFNPWLYAGPTEMHAGFFDSLHRAFPSTPVWEPRRENLLRLGRRLAPIAGFAKIVGVDGEGIVRTLLDDADEDPVAQRDRVTRELDEADQPVLVIIDDIDRLSADEVLHLFKLVRLVGRLPNVYYLLSYDERTVVDLLAKTDLVSAKDERRGLDYLEKIVQVRIDVPALRPFEVDQVFTRAMTYMQSRHAFTLPRRELELLSRMFDGVLSSRLHTPRAIKRVFGQVDAFYGALGDEVNFTDYFIITWLRTVEPGVYSLIQRHRRELLGQQLLSLRALEAPASLAERRRGAWLSMLADAHVQDTDREDILYVLSTLFPAFGPTFRAESDKQQRSGYIPPAEPGSIAHPDYFDRYFAFGVPDDDVSDAAASRAAHEIATGLEGEATTALVDVFNAQPELVVRKLSQVAERNNLCTPAFVKWVGERWSDVDERSFTRGRLESIAESALLRMTDEDAFTACQSLAQDHAGLLFVSALAQGLSIEAPGSPTLRDRRQALAERVGAELEGLYKQHFTPLVTTLPSPLDLTEQDRSTLWYWRLRESSSLSAFLNWAIDNGWELTDCMMLFVYTATGGDGTKYVERFNNVGQFTALFAPKVLRDRLAPQFPETVDLDAFRNVPATPEALRAYVLAGAKFAVDASLEAEPDE
ncbi:MAG: AAA family ATPase [Microbacterium sp.]|uniref:P-loop NTPase fold protein n=1 Tax=Microbacterium sp. TaxID=51671 RepID=UPI001D7B64D9|nr:P-loop NTPase fold protein [Microbacterium sp.]MBW8761590.1 AAA family ATPase [Microbacterium sp.]